jgi:tetratricopeptide (TPR) repeat protein
VAERHRLHSHCSGELRYLRYRGQYWQARSIAERALAVTEQALGPDDPEIAWRRSNLGTVLRDLGDLAGARTQHERALAIGEAALGPDHPTVATYRNNLGSVLQALGDLEGARLQYERGLAIGEAALGPDTRTWPPWQRAWGPLQEEAPGENRRGLLGTLVNTGPT